MFRTSTFLALALAATVSGCGGDGTPMDPLANPEPTIKVEPTGVTFTTGQFQIAPGDSFECFYTGYTTEKELSVNFSYGRQGPGGHHIVVYYTTEPQAPGHHPCRDEEMIAWRQIAGSAGDDKPGGEGSVRLPDGLAIKVPAGKQIVLQAHYINARPTAMMVNDMVTMNVVEPAQVKAYANYHVVNDDEFELAPGVVTERVSTCEVQQDLNMVLLLGHQHEDGKHFKLERVDEKGAVQEVLYEKDWEPAFTSHPPIVTFPYAKPYKLTKGTRLRQTCRWFNGDSKLVRFPREMCISFMYYYPDNGELFCPIISHP